LESFIHGVTQALKKKDGKVTLVGFGTFQKSRRKARKGRNPQTGEQIKIKAHDVVKSGSFSENRKQSTTQIIMALSLHSDIRRLSGKNTNRCVRPPEAAASLLAKAAKGDASEVFSDYMKDYFKIDYLK
jgi:nucleoid DNA-binding protein